MSSLTLGLAVERLPMSSIPVADPPDLDDFDQQAELRKNINRTLERFHAEGKWTGLIVQAAINAYGQNGKRQITLPRHLEACIRGGREGLVTRSIQSQWYQYLPGGNGIRHNDRSYCGPLQDLGQGYTTFRDIEEPSSLLIQSTSMEDDYSTLNLRVLDENGKKIWTTHEGKNVEGFIINLSDAPVIISRPVSAIYGVSKSITEGNIKVSIISTQGNIIDHEENYFVYLDVDGEGEIIWEDTQQDMDLIACYEAGERSANYRRYLVPDGLDHVKGIFKRKHVWAYSDNDPLYPDNLEAIKLGLLALNNEEKADIERAQFYMDKAILLLNNELKEHFSGLENVAQFQNWVTEGILNIH